MLLHERHFAVETLAEPAIEVSFRVLQVGVGDPDLLKAQGTAP